MSTSHHNGELTALFASDSRAPAAEVALVLESVGIHHQMHRSGHRWLVQVHEEDLARAHQQLRAYWEENRPSPIKPVPAHIIDSGWAGVLGYLLVIWCVPAMEFYTGVDLRTLGRLDAQAVMAGELWRPLTSLTLHADLGHIASNSLFGALFGLFVGRYLGSGVGWLLVLICGGLANLLNTIVQPGSFYAIGASTATFAALGLVPAFGWRRGFFRGQVFKRGFAPIFAAIALLAFTGFGAENVDALGHLFGFCAGIGMGLAAANLPLQQISVADQQRAGFAAAFIIALAWTWALL